MEHFYLYFFIAVIHLLVLTRKWFAPFHIYKYKFYLITVGIVTVLSTNLTAQSLNDFRSKQSGNWNAATSWQVYNGSAWVDATVAPSNTSGVITILSGYTITANSNIIADQIVINTNASLNITSYTFTVNNGAGIDLLNNGTINISGGTQNGNGFVEMALGSTLSWSGGYYGGTGTTKIDVGAAFNISSSNHYLSDSVTINNYGALTWTGGTFYYYNGSPTVNNYGTFNINTDNDIDNYYSNTGTFVNQSGGVINKTGSTSNDTYITDFSSFTNQGTIHILSGVFRSYMRFINTGAITIDSSAYFVTEAGIGLFKAGGNVSGKGNFNINNGTDSLIAGAFSPSVINLNNGSLIIQQTLNRAVGSTFTINNGVLKGAGVINFNNGSILNWSGGYIAETTTVNTKAGSLFNMYNSNHYFSDNIIINNYGTWTWTGGTFYYYSGSPTVNNYGTFNINTDNDVDNYYSNTGTFVNQPGAIINKTGSTGNDTYIIDFSSFKNQGTINILTGVFRTYIRFENTGSIVIDSAAYFVTEAGIGLFKAGSSVSGKGIFNINNGADSLIAGTFNPSSINLNNGNLIIQQTLNRTAGSAFTINNGVLKGAATINFNNGSTLNWSGGYIAETTTVNTKAGSSFNMYNSNHYFSDNITINNYGDWTWTGGTFYYYSGSPTVNNYGTFNINTDNDVDNYYSNTGTFVNQPGAIINKTGSAGNDTYITDFSSFKNQGTINILSGVFRTYMQFENNGTINIDTASYFATEAGIGLFKTGSNVSGKGSFNINNGIDSLITGTFAPTVVNLNNGSLVVQSTINRPTSSVFNINNGALKGSGTLNFNSGSTLNWNFSYISEKNIINIKTGSFFNMSGSNHYLSDSVTINNYGTWTWTGGTFYYFNGSPIVNNYGTFNMYTDNDIDRYNSNTGIFINQPSGIINKMGSPDNNTYISNISSFANAGTINVSSSYFLSYVKFTNTGTINLSYGSGINFTAGVGNFNAGTLIQGDGAITFNGGTDSLNAGTYSAKTINVSAGILTAKAALTRKTGTLLNLSGGTVNGAGNWNFNSGSTFNWTNGTFGGVGLNNISKGAVFTISGTSLYLTDTRIINNSTTCNWQSGTIYMNGGSPVFNNSGILNITTDNEFTGQNGTTGTFSNEAAGIINKTGSFTDDTRFQSIASFTNAGTINIKSGKLRNYMPFLNTGVINSSLGGEINFTSGIGSFNAGTIFKGAGSVTFDGGTDSIKAAAISINHLNVSAGLLNMLPNLTVATGKTITLSGGTINGTARLNFANGSVFNWSGGTIGGNDSIKINTGAIANLSGSTHYLSDTKVFANNGETEWSSGDIVFNGGNPSIINDGLFNCTTDNNISGSGGTLGVFTNAVSGVFNKEGSTSADTYVNGFTAFNNLGRININTGVINLNVSGVHSGTYNIDLGSQLTGGISLLYTGNTLSNKGTINLNGFTFYDVNSQLITGSGYIKSLTVNNNSGITINGQQTITATLSLTNGNINLEDSDLIIADGATVTAAGTSSYINTSSKGSLQRKVLNNNTNILFPIGSLSAYMPVNIALPSTSVSDFFKARVNTKLYSDYDSLNNYDPVGSSITEDVVSNCWIITEGTNGGSAATVSLQWNTNNEAAGFDRSVSRMAHYTNGTWSLDSAVAASGVNPYTIIKNNVSFFSPISVVNQFITNTNNFSSLCKGATVAVPYNAFGSFNGGNKFIAQLSNASGSFSAPVQIGSKTSVASGSINATIPANTASGSGYRIRVISSNPSFKGSDNGFNFAINDCAQIASSVNKVSEKATSPLTIYPNPTSDKIYIRLQNVITKETFANIKLLSLSGAVIYDAKTSIANDRIDKAIIFNANTPNGIYVLKISIGNQIFVRKVTLLR